MELLFRKGGAQEGFWEGKKGLGVAGGPWEKAPLGKSRVIYARMKGPMGALGKGWAPCEILPYIIRCFERALG